MNCSCFPNFDATVAGFSGSRQHPTITHIASAIAWRRDFVAIFKCNMDSDDVHFWTHRGCYMWWIPPCSTDGQNIVQFFSWGCVTNVVCTETRQDSPFGLIHQLYESYLAGASLWGVTLEVWLGGCSPRSRRREEILGTAPSEHIRVAITTLQVSISITEHPTCLLSESQRRRRGCNDSHMYSLQYYRFLIDQQGFLRVTSREHTSIAYYRLLNSHYCCCHIGELQDLHIHLS